MAAMVRTRSLPLPDKEKTPLPEEDVADLKSLISAIKEQKKSKTQQAGESSESSTSGSRASSQKLNNTELPTDETIGGRGSEGTDDEGHSEPPQSDMARTSQRSELPTDETIGDRGSEGTDEGHSEPPQSDMARSSQRSEPLSDDELEKLKADDDNSLLKVTILSSVEETCFYLPVTLLVDRELEMRKTAKQFSIEEDRWSESLLFRQWHADDTPSNISGRELRLQLNPETDCSASNHSHDLKWQPWLTNCIRSYYNTGTLRIPDQCDGSDILLALEYFGIVYSPGQLVFDTFAAYLRVKLWSDYFTHRSGMADWVVQQLLRLPSRHSHTFCTSPDLNDGAVFVLSKRVEIFDGGLDLEASQHLDHSSRGTVHDFFNDNEKDEEGRDQVELVSLMRNDFCSYLQSFLPGTHVSFSVSEVSVFLHSGLLVERKRAILQIDYRAPDSPSPAPSVNLTYRTAEELTPKSSSSDSLRTASEDEFSGIHKIIMASANPSISRRLPKGRSSSRTSKGKAPMPPARSSRREKPPKPSLPRIPGKGKSLESPPRKRHSSRDVEKRSRGSPPSDSKPMEVTSIYADLEKETPGNLSNAPSDEVPLSIGALPPLHRSGEHAFSNRTTYSEEMTVESNLPLRHIVGQEGDTQSVVSAMTGSIEAKGQGASRRRVAGSNESDSGLLSEMLATPASFAAASKDSSKKSSSDKAVDPSSQCGACVQDQDFVTATMDAFRTFLSPSNGESRRGGDEFSSPDATTSPLKNSAPQTPRTEDESSDDSMGGPPSIKRVTQRCVPEPCFVRFDGKKRNCRNPEILQDLTVEWLENALSLPQCQDLFPSGESNNVQKQGSSDQVGYNSGSDTSGSAPRTVKENMEKRQREWEALSQSPEAKEKHLLRVNQNARRTIPLKGSSPRPREPSSRTTTSRLPRSLPRAPREPKKPMFRASRRDTIHSQSTEKIGNLTKEVEEQEARRGFKGILYRKKKEPKYEI